MAIGAQIAALVIGKIMEAVQTTWKDNSYMMGNLDTGT